MKMDLDSGQNSIPEGAAWMRGGFKKAQEQGKIIFCIDREDGDDKFKNNLHLSLS